VTRTAHSDSEHTVAGCASGASSRPTAGTIIGAERTLALRRTRPITDRSLEHPTGRSSRSLKSVAFIIAMSAAQHKRPARPPCRSAPCRQRTTRGTPRPAIEAALNGSGAASEAM
jgi:hypothetical protein